MRMLALACIPIIALSGCGMLQKQPETAQVVAPKQIKKPPVRQKSAPKVVKPVVYTPSEGEGGGSKDTGGGSEPPW